MPRPEKPRWVGFVPPRTCYIPVAVPPPGFELRLLSLDELEALRLADLLGLSQEEAAAQMNISRATFGRLVARARFRVAEALVTGKALLFEGGRVAMRPAGGPYRLGPGRHGWGHGRPGRGGFGPGGPGRPPGEPSGRKADGPRRAAEGWFVRDHDR